MSSLTLCYCIVDWLVSQLWAKFCQNLPNCKFTWLFCTPSRRVPLYFYIYSSTWCISSHYANSKLKLLLAYRERNMCLFVDLSLQLLMQSASSNCNYYVCLGCLWMLLLKLDLWLMAIQMFSQLCFQKENRAFFVKVSFKNACNS